MLDKNFALHPRFHSACILIIPLKTYFYITDDFKLADAVDENLVVGTNTKLPISGEQTFFH